MNFNLKQNRLFLVFIAVLPVLTLLFSFWYSKYSDTSDRVFTILYKNAIEEKEQLFTNLLHSLHQEVDGELVDTFLDNTNSREAFETKMRLFLTHHVRYIRLLYRENGTLYYLLDTEAKSRSHRTPGTRFEPPSQAWLHAAESGMPQVYQIKHADEVSTIYLKPVVVDGKSVALLEAGLSNYDLFDIAEAINPFNQLALSTTLFLILILLIGYVQMYLYYLKRHKSSIDPLTQVFNIHYFNEIKKSIPLQEYQILLIDIDHCKHINDTYGSEIGDNVLSTIAGKLRTKIRKEDILIRYSGDRFLLLYHKQNSEHCIKMATRFLQMVRNDPIIANGQYIHATISIGINPVPENSTSIDEAMAVAERELFKAKKSGRNRYEVFAESTEDSLPYMYQAEEVSRALDEDRIKCVYQPVFHTHSLQVDTYEALVRMTGRDGSVLEPSAFLDAIRPSELYIRLCERILQITFQTMRNEPVHISLNIALEDLFDERLCSLYLEQLRNHPELAKRFTLEVSDYEEIKDTQYIRETFARLQALGVKIALDDFGSGFANFKYLLNLGIDILKLDGAIIRNIYANENRYNFIKTIHDFAKEMGVTTIAEQVENEQEIEALRAMGIEYVQGYYIAEPSSEFQRFS